MPNEFNSIEEKAIQDFENAHEEYKRGCIGHTRRRQQVLALAVAFGRIQALNLGTALTVNERADGRWCAKLENQQ